MTCPPGVLGAQRPVDGELLDEAHVQKRIHEALQEIAVNQRTAFSLRYLEGMSLPEIAEVLGCREGTVRTHIRRCLVSLRAKLAVEADRYEV